MVATARRRPVEVPPDRNLRVAVLLTFVLSGFVTASWAVRIPDVAVRVGAGHAALGAALLCVSAGALATMRLTGAMCDRVGAGMVSTLAAVLMCAVLVAPALAHTVSGLGTALLAFGAATGMLNVAMNSLGVRLEESAARPLLPSLHAASSFGGLGGSLVGGLAASVAGPAAHLLVVAVAGLGVTSWFARPLLGSDRRPVGTAHADGVSPARGPAGARNTVVVLGAIAGCTAFGEGALSDWAALHLAEDLRATPLLAAAGYAAFSLAMACARLGGHRLLASVGDTRLVVLGALLASGGMLLAALSADVYAALLGLVLVGLGLANIFPVAIARAGALAGARGVGLASTVGYGGLLLGPALIGFLAARVGLPSALTTVSVLSLVAAVLAIRVRSDVELPWFAMALPWSPAEARARLLASLKPVESVVRTAAQRHVSSLQLLAPAPVPAGLRHPGTGPTPLRDLGFLLGATPRPGNR